MTTLRAQHLTLPGSRPEENPFPCFRERAHDRAVAFEDAVEARYRPLAGRNTGARVLPYTMQDRYDRAQRPVKLRTLVLENTHLRAEFLPEFGGRLRSLWHKGRQRELLACNPLLQPANLAIRNAWFSGGIEWNVGQYGHSVLTCAPVFAAPITGPDGSPGLRLYEFERMHRVFWQTDFHLPAASEFLFAHTRVVNPSDRDASLYWWTNIAVPEAAGVRVLAPAAVSLYLTPTGGFGQAPLPGLPSLDGRDGTYATHSPGANEFFMQCEASPRPFIAALDAAGTGLVEFSTPGLGVRKLFCWGTDPGGRRWQEHLAPPGHAYLEIQAGLAPTQLHGAVLPARSTREWTEAFGGLAADPSRVHAADWNTAVAAVEAALDRAMPAACFAEIAAASQAIADIPAEPTLQHGSGWGALELRRRSAQAEPAPPPAFVFPEATLTGAPARWLPLLSGGVLSASSQPAGWLVQPEWRELLASSLARPGGRHAWSLLHLGVMALEAGDEAAAERAWRDGIALHPTAWAWRNLGTLARRREDWPAGETAYAAAWALADALDEPARIALAREVMQLHLLAGHAAAATAFYDRLAPFAQDDDGVQLTRARAALATGDLATVESVLQRDFAQIREGELSLSELWFGLWERRTAGDRPLRAEEHRAVRQAHPLPRRIDFRLKADPGG